METVTLNNGVEMPALGLGCLSDPAGRNARGSRCRAGRGIQAHRHSGRVRQRAAGRRGSTRGRLGRSEVFLETKIWISDYGNDETLHGFEKSARKLGVDQIDLLILHQALPSAFERTLEAYRALESLLANGKVRAIGVSNFMVDHLTTLLDHANVVPAVNQIECHPYFQQPIGGITFYRDGNHSSTLEDAVIGAIATAHGKVRPR